MTGSPDPRLENHKDVGSISNTGMDPLEKYKATKPEFGVGLSSTHFIYWVEECCQY